MNLITSGEFLASISKAMPKKIEKKIIASMSALAIALIMFAGTMPIKISVKDLAASLPANASSNGMSKLVPIPDNAASVIAVVIAIAVVATYKANDLVP